MKAGYSGPKQADSYTDQQAALPPCCLVSYCLPLGMGETETRGETRETQDLSFLHGKVPGLRTPNFYDPIVILENSACPLPMESRHWDNFYMVGCNLLNSCKCGHHSQNTVNIDIKKYIIPLVHLMKFKYQSNLVHHPFNT